MCEVRESVCLSVCEKRSHGNVGIAVRCHLEREKPIWLSAERHRRSFHLSHAKHMLGRGPALQRERGVFCEVRL